MFEIVFRGRKCFAVLGVLAALILPVSLTMAEEITAGGTGSSASLLKLLASEYRKTVPSFNLKVIEPPLGSSGALRALAAGKIDLATSGRAPKDDEIAALGRSFELARTPFVLVSRTGVRPKGFSLQELADVYSGKIVRWDDGEPLRLVLRSAFESDTQTLRGMSPEMDRAVQASFERKGMAVAENDLDTLDLVERVPGALAPSTLGLISTLGKNLLVLPLGGVTPTARAVADGSYPWNKPMFVVIGKAPRPVVLDFVAFLRSARAREVLLRHEYLPGKE